MNSQKTQWCNEHFKPAGTAGAPSIQSNCQRTNQCVYSALSACHKSNQRSSGDARFSLPCMSAPSTPFTLPRYELRCKLCDQFITVWSGEDADYCSIGCFEIDQDTMDGASSVSVRAYDPSHMLRSNMIAKIESRGYMCSIVKRTGKHTMFLIERLDPQIKSALKQ